jgi:hypothetical protein
MSKLPATAWLYGESAIDGANTKTKAFHQITFPPQMHLVVTYQIDNPRPNEARHRGALAHQSECGLFETAARQGTAGDRQSLTFENIIADEFNGNAA